MKLRILLIGAALIGLGASQSGCMGLPGGGGNFDINTFLNSTTCAHDDEVQGVTGAAGIPASLQFKAARHCPGQAPAASGSPAPVQPSTPAPA